MAVCGALIYVLDIHLLYIICVDFCVSFVLTMIHVLIICLPSMPCFSILKPGWLPLHWAATFHKSPAVISAIIEAYPEALHKETNKGKTPYRCARSSQQRDIVDKGIDIAADRGIDVNPPRMFMTAKVKEEDGGSTTNHRGARRRSGSGGGMRRFDSSGSVGSLGASFSDLFGGLGRRKSRSGPSGGSRSDLSAGGGNASWDDVGGTSRNTGSAGHRKSSSRGDEPLRRRRRSRSRDAIVRALGNLMNEHESNASLDIDEAVLRGGHGSSSGSGSRSAIAAGSSGLRSRREDDPPRGSRRRSSSQDAIARVIGKLMNSDQSLIDEDVIKKGETNALISEYVNPGDDAAAEERGENVGNEERVAGGQLGNGRRRSEPNLVVLSDVNFGDNGNKDSSTRARRGRRRSRSSDRSIDILESTVGQDQPVELTSRAAVDNYKEGVASASASSLGSDHQPMQSRESASGSRRRSGSIDAINRVIKAVGVKSFELVETDADERPVMERKSSAKLE